MMVYFSSVVAQQLLHYNEELDPIVVSYVAQSRCDDDEMMR